MWSDMRRFLLFDPRIFAKVVCLVSGSNSHKVLENIPRLCKLLALGCQQTARPLFVCTYLLGKVPYLFVRCVLHFAI